MLPEEFEEYGLDSSTVDLRGGKYLDDFLTVGGTDSERKQQILLDTCKGISRLEDLPPQAIDQEEYVPLRIAPRTPTETILWVNKKRRNFSLKPLMPRFMGDVSMLPTNIQLIYSYLDGRVEKLIIGARLFHILMEIKNGYQLSDMRSDDVFANLSIFKQRLAQEEESELFAWNPMHESIIRISIDLINGVQMLVMEPFQKR